MHSKSPRLPFFLLSAPISLVFTRRIKDMENQNEKKMKILCLHGFRTSGSFLKKQISKWDPSIFAHFDLDFPDGIYPAQGKSDIEGIFPPPYFEWFQFNKDFTEYTNLDECVSYLCDYIKSNGPFDGLLGFSQGATLSALLLGYQAQGKVLKEQPEMKLFVSISGSKFREPSICEVAYKYPIKVKSIHFIGAKDWLKVPSEELATAFDNPLIICHPQGHTVPRLDEEAIKQLRSWTEEILQCKNIGTTTSIANIINGNHGTDKGEAKEGDEELKNYSKAANNNHEIENGEPKVIAELEESNLKAANGTQIKENSHVENKINERKVEVVETAQA